MRKLAFILLLSVLFIGCGHEWVPKEKKTQTVHILEIGSFNVKGEIDYEHSGRVEFTDITGMTITTHISRCVIVEASIQPKPPQVQQPVKAPVAKPAVKKVPPKVPVKKSGK